MSREIKFRAWQKSKSILFENIQTMYSSFWDIIKDENPELLSKDDKDDKDD